MLSCQSDCLALCSRASRTVWHCALVPVGLSGTVLSCQSDCLALCSRASRTVWYCAFTPVGLSGTVLSHQSDCLVLYWYCAGTVLVLCWYCADTVLLHQSDCLVLCSCTSQTVWCCPQIGWYCAHLVSYWY